MGLRLLSGERERERERVVPNGAERVTKAACNMRVGFQSLDDGDVVDRCVAVRVRCVAVIELT